MALMTIIIRSQDSTLSGGAHNPLDQCKLLEKAEPLLVLSEWEMLVY